MILTIFVMAMLMLFAMLCVTIAAIKLGDKETFKELAEAIITIHKTKR